jgi:hypothetical protein
MALGGLPQGCDQHLGIRLLREDDAGAVQGQSLQLTIGRDAGEEDDRGTWTCSVCRSEDLLPADMGQCSIDKRDVRRKTSDCRDAACTIAAGCNDRKIALRRKNAPDPLQSDRMSVRDDNSGLAHASLLIADNTSCSRLIQQSLQNARMTSPLDDNVAPSQIPASPPFDGCATVT